MNPIRDTVEYIVKGIVADPSVVSIEETVTDDGVTALVIVVPADITGQIIGKQGKVIKAIRTILMVSYPQQKFTLDLKN